MNRRQFLGAAAVAANLSVALEDDVDGISQETAAEVVSELVDPARRELVATNGTPEEAVPLLEAALVELREVDSV